MVNKTSPCTAPSPGADMGYWWHQDTLAETSALPPHPESKSDSLGLLTLELKFSAWNSLTNKMAVSW